MNRANSMAVAVACALLLSRSDSMRGEPREPGVVVVEVQKDFVGRKAGADGVADIQPGDLLQAWSQGDGRRRDIASPFDFEEAEEQGVRGPTTIHGLRAGEKRTWVLPPGSWDRWLSKNRWGLEVRPLLPERLLAMFEEGRGFARNGRKDVASGRFCQAADAARLSGGGPSDDQKMLTAWFLLRAARELSSRSPSEADPLFSEAVRNLPERSRPDVLFEWGTAYQAIEEPALQSLGFIQLARGDYAAAERSYRRAVELASHLESPGSIIYVSLMNLGVIASRQGDQVAAEGYHRASLAERERVAPNNLVGIGFCLLNWPSPFACAATSSKRSGW